MFKEAKWIVPDSLENLRPINVFHKECMPRSIELPEQLKNLHILYRSTFSYNTGPALLRITADDYYKVYVNGKLVGMGPAQGYYFNYYWNQYNLTPFLKEGKNEITVDVYYHGLISRSYTSGDRRLGLIAEIENDGKIILHTDDKWQCAFSKAYLGKTVLGYNTSFAENYDSRQNISEWRFAVSIAADYSFSDQPACPLQFYSLRPSFIESLPNGALFCDFGTEITAHLKVSAYGRAGQKVRIMHAEETDLSSEYKIRYSMRCKCLCDETWTLADGENTHEQYDYKAFRYVTLHPESGVKIQDISATVRHYPFPDDFCTLETNDKRLYSIWTICKNAVKYGAQEVFVDCSMREKGQYAGDLTVTSSAHVILTGDTSLLKKAIDNQIQSSFICDGLMAVTPGSHMQEIADYSLQFPLLVLNYYYHTHDSAYLSESYEYCQRLIRHFQKFARQDGLLADVTDKWNLVDWPENMRDNYDFELTNPIPSGSGCHNVINAFYIGTVMCTEHIAEILGLNIESHKDSLIKAFHNAFFREEIGLYADSEVSGHCSLHSNTIPAFFGFYPPEYKKTIGDFLVKKGMSCGVYMSYFLLKALCRMGRLDDAYRLIVNEGEHSWCNMLREGATTCFEAWGKEQKANTSLCHPWASAPISVLAEDILPNRPDIGVLHYKYINSKGETNK